MSKITEHTAEQILALRASRKRHRDTWLFGGNREIAIQRDGEKCVRCGMTREQHKAKYGYDITVDHIDGRGSHTAKALKNNNLDNLQTLCSRCHARKDVQTRVLTPVQTINITHIGQAATHTRIAELWGISPTRVRQLFDERFGADKREPRICPTCDRTIHWRGYPNHRMSHNDRRTKAAKRGKIREDNL